MQVIAVHQQLRPPDDQHTSGYDSDPDLSAGDKYCGQQGPCSLSSVQIFQICELSFVLRLKHIAVTASDWYWNNLLNEVWFILEELQKLQFLYTTGTWRLKMTDDVVLAAGGAGDHDPMWR